LFQKKNIFIHQVAEQASAVTSVAPINDKKYWTTRYYVIDAIIIIILLTLLWLKIGVLNYYYKIIFASY